MKFKALLIALAASLSTMRTRYSDTVKALPPPEQFSENKELVFAHTSLANSSRILGEELTRFEGELKTMESQADELLKTEAETMAKGMVETQLKEQLEAKIKSGEYLPKDVAQAAADKAANDAKTEVRLELKKVNDRRVELFTKKGETPAILTREVAESLSEAILLADNYLDSAKKVASRLQELHTLGVPVPSLMSKAAITPLDEAGDQAFKAELSLAKEISDKATGKGVKGAPAPFAGAGGQGDGKVTVLV